MLSLDAVCLSANCLRGEIRLIRVGTASLQFVNHSKQAREDCTIDECLANSAFYLSLAENQTQDGELERHQRSSGLGRSALHS